MTPEEAKKILIESRPDRPQSTNRRKYQRAVDTILEALKDREEGRWVVDEVSGNLVCSLCHTSLVDDPKSNKFCRWCGAYMGVIENDE
jgi:hypothetical protein